MDQAGGVCTSRDAQASGISRVDLHGTPRFAIRQWTEIWGACRRPFKATEIRDLQDAAVFLIHRWRGGDLRVVD